MCEGLWEVGQGIFPCSEIISSHQAAISELLHWIITTCWFQRFMSQWSLY